MKQKGKNRSQFRKNSNKFRTSEKKKRKKPRANISFECVHEAISVERQRVAISTSPDFIARIKSRMNSRGNAMYKSANINAYPFRILLVITVPYVSFPTWQRQFATPNRTGYLMLVALCLLDPWRTIELRPLNRPRGAFHDVHTLVSRRLFAGYVDIYVYTMYIYMCVCIPSTVKIQYFTGADNLDGYAGSVFSSAVECRLVLRVYHYPITMVYEDVWLYFPGWNWRHNLPCQRKLLYRGGEEELPIYYRGREEERHGLLEAVTICQNELSLDWRVLAITHVKFEARGVFLETNSKIS